VQPRTPEEGYHLTEDLVDEAIGWLNGSTRHNEAVVHVFLHWRDSRTASHA
jgi:hypothetical protein